VCRHSGLQFIPLLFLTISSHKQPQTEPMDPATIRFRLAVPFALFPASPPLAALHASRAQTLHPDHVQPDSPACSRCGSLLIQYPRSFKNKKKKNKRVLRLSCRICGTSTDALFPPATFPPARSHNTITSQPPIIPEPSPPSPPKSVSPAPLTPAPKSRPKKKAGLQQLLAQNRENKERERQKQKQSDSQFGGLAAFLSDLS
jgi:hypothetical protein